MLRPTVALAQADDEATAGVIGVVTADLPDATYGYVAVIGKVNSVDMSSFSTRDRDWET